MKVNWKKVGIGFAAFLVAFFVIGFFLPKNIYVEHEEHIVAAPKMIFVFIGDFQNWPKWSPWAKKDPNMTVEYSDPSYGVNATQSWKSSSMGEGTLTMTNWNIDNGLSYQMKSGDWPPSTGEMRFSFPNQGAVVKWTMDGPLKSTAPHMRWFGLLMRWFIKRDFRAGLTNLKNLCESSDATTVNGPWHEKAAEAAGAKKTPAAKGAIQQPTRPTTPPHGTKPGSMPTPSTNGKPAPKMPTAPTGLKPAPKMPTPPAAKGTATGKPANSP